MMNEVDKEFWNEKRNGITLNELSREEIKAKGEMGSDYIAIIPVRTIVTKNGNNNLTALTANTHASDFSNGFTILEVWNQNVNYKALIPEERYGTVCYAKYHYEPTYNNQARIIIDTVIL